MKKFIKIFVICVLVMATVGVSCWLFFSKLKKEPEVYSSVNSFIFNEKQKNIDAEIDFLIEISSEKFGEFKATNQNLIDITKSLNCYLISSNYSVNKTKLKKSLNELLNKQANLITTYGEYNQKVSANSSFDKQTGSFVVFDKFSEYFVSYSKFLNLLNEEVSSSIKEKSADVKFYLFEVYLDVVENDFSNLNSKENGEKSLSDKNSVEIVNTFFKITNGYINLDTTSENFGIESRIFVDKYSNCNHNLFAKSLKENLTLVTNLESATTNEQIAVYYLKEMYNI